MIQEKHKIVVCSCHETGLLFMTRLLEDNFKISQIVTISSELAKKNVVSGFCDFSNFANKHDIPIYFAESYSLQGKRDIDFFKENKFDLLIQGGWQRIFPQHVLDALRVGAIGVHGSSEFLPKGRGRATINWSLIENKKRFISHYFLIKPGIDDGDIFHYEMFDINEWDDCRTLYYKTSIITYRVLREWIPKLLSGSFELIPQQGEATYYLKRSPEDGLLDWNKLTVFEIYNHIRAQTTPYPGAYSYINGNKIAIWQAQPFDTRITFPQAKSGEIVEIFSTGDLAVNCISGLLLITKYDCEIPLQRGLILDNTR